MSPSGPAEAPIARLVAERGATMPTAELLAIAAERPRPAGGPPSARVIEELREERL